MEVQKIALAALIALGLGVLLAKKSRAASPEADVLITGHDAVWDYRRAGGVWYTRRKAHAPDGAWLNMQSSLSPENYRLAISKLESYLYRK